MATFATTRRLLIIGAAALMLGGCATHSPTHTAANPASSTAIDPNVAALLAQNALAERNGVIALGAGDRFGHRVFDHYVALVHMRELNHQMVAEVPTSTH